MKKLLSMLLAVLITFTPLTANASGHLTRSGGVYFNDAGFKETYYNLRMGTVVKYMRALGYSEEEYPYWVSDSGIKMLGDYVMVAAHLGYYPKGTIVETSWGDGIVCDTGYLQSNQLDLAVTW